jgi:hypothetical protein
MDTPRKRRHPEPLNFHEDDWELVAEWQDMLDDYERGGREDWAIERESLIRSDE